MTPKLAMAMPALRVEGESRLYRAPGRRARPSHPAPTPLGPDARANDAENRTGLRAECHVGRRSAL